MSYLARPFSNKNVFTGTGTTVATVTGLDGAREILVDLTVNGGETGGILLSCDGTNFSSAIKPIDMSTNAAAAAATLATGFYKINTPVSAFKVTKSAGVQSCTVRYIAVF